MKDESGSHFPLPMELKKRRINRKDRLSCKENEHKITRRRIPFILNNVRDVAIPYCLQIHEIPSVIDMHMVVDQCRRHMFV